MELSCLGDGKFAFSRTNIIETMKDVLLRKNGEKIRRDGSEMIDPRNDFSPILTGFEEM